MCAINQFIKMLFKNINDLVTALKIMSLVHLLLWWLIAEVMMKVKHNFFSSLGSFIITEFQNLIIKQCRLYFQYIIDL